MSAVMLQYGNELIHRGMWRIASLLGTIDDVKIINTIINLM
jgi:hypothetical protein